MAVAGSRRRQRLLGQFTAHPTGPCTGPAAGSGLGGPARAAALRRRRCSEPGRLPALQQTAATLPRPLECRKLASYHLPARPGMQTLQGRSCRAFRSPPTCVNAPHRCHRALGPCSTPHRTHARYAAAAAQAGRPWPAREAGQPACGRRSASRGTRCGLLSSTAAAAAAGGSRRRRAPRRWCPARRGGARGASCRHHGSRPASWHS